VGKAPEQVGPADVWTALSCAGQRADNGVSLRARFRGSVTLRYCCLALVMPHARSERPCGREGQFAQVAGSQSLTLVSLLR
jgi:hypothetical protein